VVGPEYRRVLDRMLPGAFAQAVADADTFFRIEFPALEQWNFTQAEARRITQPVLAVLGADSATLWPGWEEGYRLVQDWLPQTEAALAEVYDWFTKGFDTTDLQEAKGQGTAGGASVKSWLLPGAEARMVK
jgi:hypothetical protein